MGWTLGEVVFGTVLLLPLVSSFGVNKALFLNRSERSTQLPMTPENGSIVTVDCRLLPEGDFVPEPLFDGIVLDEEQPASRLAFVLGAGNYLPGLHDLVASMKEGQSVECISLDAGWGAWNPNLKVNMSFESLANSGLDSTQIKVGVQLALGTGLVAVVTDVSDEGFVIDANPPLAGASYLANVKLISVEPGPGDTQFSPESSLDSKFQVATFALGCFWGGELEFMRAAGVVGTKVGYTQGSLVNPTYKEVCSGTSGHTEAIQVVYDPSVVTYGELVHLAMDRLGGDKYLLNQVGNDKGTQYRHGVYFHNDKQKEIAEQVVGSFGEDCVTEVLKAERFYDAEDYHQQYLLKGGQSARKGDLSAIRCYG